MHGEYKTPAGKLVVVDLEVSEGRLAAVMVSGDFFLEPPEALDAIREALRGAPAASSEAELADRVARALGPDVRMVGFTPQAVARAVGRALE